MVAGRAGAGTTGPQHDRRVLTSSLGAVADPRCQWVEPEPLTRGEGGGPGVVDMVQEGGRVAGSE